MLLYFFTLNLARSRVTKKILLLQQFLRGYVSEFNQEAVFFTFVDPMAVMVIKNNRAYSLARHESLLRENTKITFDSSSCWHKSRRTSSSTEIMNDFQREGNILLTRIRRQEKHSHRQEGHQHSRNDEYDRVEERLASGMKR